MQTPQQLDRGAVQRRDCNGNRLAKGAIQPHTVKTFDVSGQVVCSDTTKLIVELLPR